MKLLATWVAMAATLLAGDVARGEPAWGEPNKAGLVTRLVPLEQEYQVGQPITFRLEVKNTSEEVSVVDLQNLAHPQCQLAVSDARGVPLPIISAALAGCQTIQDDREFPPGETVMVAGGLDAADVFLIAEEGTYRFRYPGLLGAKPVPVGDAKAALSASLPPSPEIALVVKKGTLPADLKMIVQLRAVVPQDWTLCRRWIDGGVYLGDQGQGPLGMASIELVAVDPNAEIPLEEGQKVLGSSPLGEIRMGVTLGPGKGDDDPDDPRPNPTLDQSWPGAVDAIRKALEIAPTET